jgi:hypothetical protein
VHTLEIDHGSTSLTRYGCPQTIAPLRVTAKDKKLCDRTRASPVGLRPYCETPTLRYHPD